LSHTEFFSLPIIYFGEWLRANGSASARLHGRGRTYLAEYMWQVYHSIPLPTSGFWKSTWHLMASWFRCANARKQMSHPVFLTLNERILILATAA